MNALRRWLRKNPWAAFAILQVMLFGSGWAALNGIRWFTGRTLHGGVDPAGPIDGLVVIVVYGLHFALTVWIYRVVMGHKAPPLGLVPSRRGMLEFAAGALAATMLAAWPWVLALALGQIRIIDTITPHFRAVGLASIAFGWLLLLVNSVVEETTSRAFPMRIWAGRSLWFRVLVPSLVFATFHLIDERFQFGSFAARTLAGVTLGMAYAATGNIWLAAGVHTGMNFGSAVKSGLWHMGALINLSGDAPVPGWAKYLVMAALAVGLYWMGARRMGSAPETTSVG